MNAAGASQIVVERRRSDRRVAEDRRRTGERRGHFGRRISVVIPARNEAKNLPYVLPLIPEWVDEIILVDGQSTDGTPRVAKQVCPRVRIIPQRGKGKGDALRLGFEAATGDIIVMLDADGSMDPAEIPAFVGLLLAGADFVKGSRFSQGGGTADMEPHRQLGNWALTQLVRLFHGGSYQDLCYGYNAFWRRVLPELNLNGDGFEIETEMNVRALRAGLKVAEVPSFERPRIHGESNLNAMRDGLRVLRTILVEWTCWLGGRRTKEVQASAPGQGQAAAGGEMEPAVHFSPAVVRDRSS